MRSIHLKVRDIACEQCDYKTSLRQHLKNHIKAAHNICSDFVCKYCDYKTNHKFDLQQHEKAVHVKIKDNKCKLCDFTTSYPQVLKRHMRKRHVGNAERRNDLAYKVCFVKLVPLKNEVTSTCSTSSEMLEEEESFDAVTEAVTESLKKEEPIGAVTEAVAESLKEAVGKEVKRRIGEAVALYLFDQWWAKAEEKYNAVKERKVGEESDRMCHLCKFTALSENNLTEHLMINHVFDLNLSQ